MQYEFETFTYPFEDDCLFLMCTAIKSELILVSGEKSFNFVSMTHSLKKHKLGLK